MFQADVHYQWVGGDVINSVRATITVPARPRGSAGSARESPMGGAQSSYSNANGGNCVEVASAGTAVVAVRDSKDPDGPKLAFPAEQWRAFTYQIQAGELG